MAQATEKRKLIYLAGPYSTGIPSGHPPNMRGALMMAREAALTWTAAWLSRTTGAAVFSPITHGAPICAEGHLPMDHEFWAPVNDVMLKACDVFVVVMLTGFDLSLGRREEEKKAQALGKVIKYIYPPLPAELETRLKWAA